MTPKHFKDGRLELGLTQKSLGAFVGVSKRQIKRYEQGVSGIPGPLAILIDTPAKKFTRHSLNAVSGKICAADPLERLEHPPFYADPASV